MAGLTEFYCGWNEPSHASQFKWLEYTFKQCKCVKCRKFKKNKKKLYSLFIYTTLLTAGPYPCIFLSTRSNI
jgi:hypothetical protein